MNQLPIVQKLTLLTFLRTTHCLSLVSTSNLAAATLLSPTAVLGTDLGVADPLTSLANMINHSGLDKPFTSGVTDFDTYFSVAPQPFAQASDLNNWRSNFTFTLPLTGYVDFDFGAVWSIERLAIWNISLKDITILASENSPTTFNPVANFSLPSHLSFFFSYSPDVLNLGTTVNARYIRLKINSAHLFSPTDTFAYAVVGELAASAAPVVTDRPGDFNTDTIVDAADYTVWRDNLGTNFDLGGNGDENGASAGIVDPADYALWKVNFGDAISGAGFRAVVPEPSTFVLFLFGISAGSLPRRREAVAAPH